MKTVKKPRLTRKQKAFVDEILNDPKISATQAALKTYDVNNDVTAASVGYENLRKPQILQYLADHAKDAEMTVIEHMHQRKDKRLSFDAAKDVLDRTHGRATQRTEVTSTGVNLTIDLATVMLGNSGNTETVERE